MPVGFKLPPGTQSRAYNLVTPGEIMDLSVHPFIFPPGSQESLAAISKRYGHAKQFPGEPFQLPDTQGLHVTDYQSALEVIWQQNPTWFAANGLGNAAGGDGQATQEEYEDAKYAMAFGDQVLAEAKRLSLAGQGAAPVDPSPVHPPPPPPPSPGGPLGGGVSGDPGTVNPTPSPSPAPQGELVPPQVVVALASLAAVGEHSGLAPVHLSKLKRVVSFFTGVERVIRS